MDATAPQKTAPPPPVQTGAEAPAPPIATGDVLFGFFPNAPPPPEPT